VPVAGIHPKENQDGFPIKNVGNDEEEKIPVPVWSKNSNPLFLRISLRASALLSLLSLLFFEPRYTPSRGMLS
jgi:hypothetical protein